MGRDAKRKRDEQLTNGTRIKLSREQYFEVKAKQLESAAVALEAKQAAEQFGKRQYDIQVAVKALLEQFGKEHGFDPTNKSYGFDDATCELVEHKETT